MPKLTKKEGLFLSRLQDQACARPAFGQSKPSAWRAPAKIQCYRRRDATGARAHARDWRIDGQGQRAQHPAGGVERRYEEPS
jgi:hypothetical protein